MKERKTWGDFYEKAGDADYFLDHLAIHKDFLKEILKNDPKALLEAGCGSAIMSIFFGMSGRRATACDLDEKVLAMAAETAKKWNAQVQFSKQDLMKMSFPDRSFDVVFSQGVLEHMADDEIRVAARESLRVGKKFIFSVPNYYYKHKDFGNERLLKAEEWKRILSGIGNAQFKYYFAIRTKKNFLMKKPLMLMGILTA